MNKSNTYYLDIDKQIEKLHSEGIEYRDKNTIKNLLQTIGSYNIKVYTFRHYKYELKYFEDKSDIIYIHKLYNFDCELRNIIMDIATNIEMRFKAYIGNYIGREYGAIGHLNEENFCDTDIYNNFVKVIKKKNKEPTKYYCNSDEEEFHDNTNKFPVWLACQQLTLGELSKMYGNLQSNIQESIIKENYNNKDVIENWYFVKGWLKGITEMRNICAHNDKLFDWKSTFKNDFGLPKPYKSNCNPKSLFTALVISKLLMNDKYTINNYDWNIFANRLENCISKYSFNNNFDPLYYMEFPDDWKEILS